jgi:hypothetical protein
MQRYAADKRIPQNRRKRHKYAEKPDAPGRTVSSYIGLWLTREGCGFEPRRSPSSKSRYSQNEGLEINLGSERLA